MINPKEELKSLKTEQNKVKAKRYTRNSSFTTHGKKINVNRFSRWQK